MKPTGRLNKQKKRNEKTMKNKLHKKSCCPKCGGELEFDAGFCGSYWEPPQDPFVACTECDWSPDLEEVDWEYVYSYKPNPEQQERIDALRIEVEKAYSEVTRPENRSIPTLEDLFKYATEGDFNWEGEPEDVGNAYVHDGSWNVSFECIDMGRENGKRWFIVYSGDRDGNYDSVAGFDEREGHIITDDVLADLWFHCEGRLHSHFAGRAKYNLDCAETGEDPLKNWIREFSCEDAIKAAEDNLKYLTK